MNLKKLLPKMSVILTFGLLLSSCSSPANTVNKTEAPSVMETKAEITSIPTNDDQIGNLMDLSGDIVIDGSSTVYPITTAVA